MTINQYSDRTHNKDVEYGQFDWDNFIMEYTGYEKQWDRNDYRAGYRDIGVSGAGTLFVNGKEILPTPRSMKQFVRNTIPDKARHGATAEDLKLLRSRAAKAVDFTFWHGDNELLARFLEQFKGVALSGKPMLIRARNLWHGDAVREDTVTDWSQVWAAALSDRYARFDGYDFAQTFDHLLSGKLASLRPAMMVWKTGWSNPDRSDFRVGMPTNPIMLSDLNGATTNEEYALGFRFRTSNIGSGTAEMQVGILNSATLTSLVFGAEAAELLGLPVLKIYHKGNEKVLKGRAIGEMETFLAMVLAGDSDDGIAGAYKTLAAASNSLVDWDSILPSLQRKLRLSPEDESKISQSIGKHGATALGVINGIAEVAKDLGGKAGTAEKSAAVDEFNGTLLARFGAGKNRGDFEATFKAMPGLPGTDDDDAGDEDE